MTLFYSVKRENVSRIWGTSPVAVGRLQEVVDKMFMAIQLLIEKRVCILSLRRGIISKEMEVRNGVHIGRVAPQSGNREERVKVEEEANSRRDGGCLVRCSQ